MSGKFLVALDYDAADALLISVLQEYLRMVRDEPRCIEEDEYREQLFAAANFVIEHFGGEPISKATEETMTAQAEQENAPLS
jgi:hypothetical protein